MASGSQGHPGGGREERCDDHDDTAVLKRRLQLQAAELVRLRQHSTELEEELQAASVVIVELQDELHSWRVEHGGTAHGGTVGVNALASETGPGGPADVVSTAQLESLQLQLQEKDAMVTALQLTASIANSSSPQLDSLQQSSLGDPPTAAAAPKAKPKRRKQRQQTLDFMLPKHAARARVLEEACAVHDADAGADSGSSMDAGTLPVAATPETDSVAATSTASGPNCAASASAASASKHPGDNRNACAEHCARAAAAQRALALALEAAWSREEALEEGGAKVNALQVPSVWKAERRQLLAACARPPDETNA
eukprot:COSAG01_NODE_4566_length_4918_cov_6.112056_2_plen_312_part_00